jgi:outer membrane receptor protein involved in Fe transport
MKLSVRRGNLLRSSALAVLLVAGVASRVSAADPTYQFNIPAESLSQALTDFSQTSSQQIIYTEDLVRGRNSAGLHGSFTAEQALESLLAGTGLKVQVNAAGVMMVQSKNVQAASNEAATPVGSVETVVVTGTQLHGVDPLSPPVVYDRDTLLAQGYGTLTNALQQLPQNFKGGVSEESNQSNGAGAGATNNYSFASGVNLKGLGPGATLVLLNGNRLAPTAFGGTTDISGIPLSAIERIEILPDGASATYGSDAVSGVVNIITRRDYSGAETGFRIDGISEGKDPDYTGYQLVGTDWDSGGGLLNYQYESQNPLYASKRSFTSSAADPTFLLPEQRTQSVYGSLHQSLGADLSFQGDALYSDRSVAASVLSPGFSLVNTKVRAKQFTGTGELNYSIGDTWNIDLVGDYGKETDNDSTSYLSINSGYIDNVDYTVSSGELRADGELFDLPGGSTRLALGASARAESFRDHNASCSPSGCSGAVYPQNRTIYALYGELLIPVIGADNQLPFVQSLRIDIAGRFDHYSDFGSSTNPKLTAEWQIDDQFTVRGGYSTSFKAPTLYEVNPDEINVGYIYTVTDPASGTGTTESLILDGTNPDLKPEQSTSYNASIVFKPESVPGFELTASYFNISYTNQIERLLTVDDTFDLFLAEANQFGSLITRNPSVAQVNSALNYPGRIIVNINGTPYTAGDIGAIAKLGYNNAAATYVDGINANAKYDRDTSVGNVSVDLNLAYFLDYNQRIAPAAPKFDYVGVIYDPARYRAALNVGWQNGAWGANARLNYTDGERNPNDPKCAGGCSVSSWTTLDLAGSYRLSKSGDLTFGSGLIFSASITNVFDSKPPYAFAYSGINYDGTNANPLGRTLSLALTKSW